MPFPLAFEGLQIPGLRALSFVIASDLAAGGGTVRSGTPTRVWVTELVRLLTAPERRALLETLISVRRPDSVELAARVIDGLEDPSLGLLAVGALRVHDLGLLLHAVHEGTVEGLLAAVAARHGDLSASDARTPVLEALRNTGQSRLEAEVLVRWGTAEEVLQWGADLLPEGDPEIEEILEGGLRRPEIALSILKLFPDL